MLFSLIDYLPPKEIDYLNTINELYKNPLKIITLQITEDCCLSCTYCYQHHKTHNVMSYEIAKKFIDNLLTNQYSICNTENTQTIILEFIGGEPLLEIKLIHKITDYIYNSMIKMSHPWLLLFRINICSNGVLYFQPEVQSFLQKYNNICSFCISIDGNKQLHDACRIDKNGNGSYDIAIAAMKHYKKTFGIQMSTKMTIAPENISFLSDALINLINEGYIIIHANCIFENVWNDNLARILYNEMIIIADYLIDNNLYNKVNISLFNETAFTMLDPLDNKNYCGGIADTNLSLDYQGKFYSCIRYMESSLNGKQPPLIIGDIENGYLGLPEYQKNYEMLNNITRKSQSSQKCFECPIGSGCGWCSAFNYEDSGKVNQRNTYICLMHQARALANQYYWNKLYKKLQINKNKKIILPYDN